MKGLRARFSLGALLTAALFGRPAAAFDLNDSLKGSTQGNALGGALTAEGWQVTSRTDRLWYAIPTLSSGSIEFSVKDVTTANLLVNDNEIFAMYEAGFGIGEPIVYAPAFRENHYKCMIRIYGQAEVGRTGAQKFMWGICPAGAPGYGACGCQNEFPIDEPFGGDPSWDGSPQRLRVERGGGHARMLRNGATVHDIDYSGSGAVFGPESQHFSLGSSRADAVGSSGMPVGAVFYDLVVTGTEGPVTSCAATGSGGAAGAGGASGAQTTSFQAVADSWSEPAAPSAVHGSDVDLQTGGDGRTIYLRFDVQGLSGKVERARILLSATNGGGGGEIHAVSDNSWSEAALSHQSRPAPEAAILSNVGTVGIGDSVEFDVSAAVKGDGLHSFAITSSNTDGSAYASREAAGPHPMLVIDTIAGVSSGGAGGGPSGGAGGWVGSDAGKDSGPAGGAPARGSTEEGGSGCGCRLGAGRSAPGVAGSLLLVICALRRRRR